MRVLEYNLKDSLFRFILTLTLIFILSYECMKFSAIIIENCMKFVIFICFVYTSESKNVNLTI